MHLHTGTTRGTANTDVPSLMPTGGHFRALFQKASEFVCVPSSMCGNSHRPPEPAVEPSRALASLSQIVLNEDAKRCIYLARSVAFRLRIKP